MKPLLSFSISVVSFLLLLTGCGTARHAASVDNRTDSTRIEIRTQYIEHVDTVYVEIPKIVEKVTTRDTLSRLENDYALSVAEIRTGGYLYHTLETKPEKRPVAVVESETVRDSIVYRDKEVYIEQPVEIVKPRSTFEKVEIWGFWILIGIIALYIFIKIKF